MSLGWGQPPWGIGDWGSENTVAPDARAVSLAGSPPVLNRDVIPAGGAKISGSAPVIVSTEFRIRPDTAVVSIAGQVPVQDRTTDPAVGAVNIVGIAPSIGITIAPATSSLTATGIASSLDIKVVVGSGALSLVGQAPEVRLDFFITPAANDAVIAGFVPTVEQSALDIINRLL